MSSRDLDEASSESSGTSYASPSDNKSSSIGKKLLAKMGYTEGKGLGKYEQGISEAIQASNQKGRRGLGFTIQDVKVDVEFEWSEEKELEFVSVEEEVSWIPEPEDETPPSGDLEKQGWATYGPEKLKIDDEFEFCDENIVRGVCDCKSVFDQLSDHELRKCRSESNPFETIEKGIFQNRAAMKMANIDTAFDFMFTQPKDARNNAILKKEDLLYFADICAGPGGFSEYVLWRKGWEAKGFGFTLRGPNDFKLEEFYAGSPESFEAHYGVDPREGDGNIYHPQNLIEFRNHVLNNSESNGVHFVMADGGFSVEGQENLQEILSKRLYLCQFLCALGILRTGGHFVCKLFDCFTPFSVGLIYIMYRCFNQICIFKPNTSRPANSERYLVCKSKKSGTGDVENYLFKLNCHLDLVSKKKSQNENDITDCVPRDILKSDLPFFNYITESNTKLGRRQILFLSKVKAFAENPELKEMRHVELKNACLARWMVPKKGRTAPPRHQPSQRFLELMPKTRLESFKEKPKALLKSNLKSIEFFHSFKCLILSGDDPTEPPSPEPNRFFILALGKGYNYRWDGTSLIFNRLPESLKVSLPPDTLVYVEVVNEMQGEGKAQRKNVMIHIIDALILGGKDVRQEPYEERMMYATKMAKSVKKCFAHDVVPLRVKPLIDLANIRAVMEHLMIRQMKGGNLKFRLAFDLDEKRFMDAAGLLFIPIVSDAYLKCWSKSQEDYYYFHKKSGRSIPEQPKDSIASCEESFAHRFFWKWDVDGTNTKDTDDGRPPPPVKNREDVLDKYLLFDMIQKKS